ncbi:hypothetical protein B0O80DRAFT_367316, partial [Mortierella sp. GBAus27b]
VYEVERVVGHKRERGVLSYHLKWKGYPDSDNTWERDKSVFCKDLVEAYWERYLADGGSKADARGKEPKSNGQAIEVRENWKPPKSWTTWDEHVEVVQTVERSIMGMTVHVTWKNGKESELPLEEAHKKCPQKLIAFYEQHLKF